MRNLTGRPATAEQTDAEWTEWLQGRSDLGRGLGYWIGRADGVFVGWWGLSVLMGSKHSESRVSPVSGALGKRPGCRRLPGSA
jgi:hypothetical protein